MMMIIVREPHGDNLGWQLWKIEAKRVGENPSEGWGAWVGGEGRGDQNLQVWVTILAKREVKEGGQRVHISPVSCRDKNELMFQVFLPPPQD